jgi:hypothetical protein
VARYRGVGARLGDEVSVRSDGPQPMGGTEVRDDGGEHRYAALADVVC